MATAIYKGCDHRIKLSAAKDVDGNFINNGTCVFELSDDDGTVLATGTLPYITNSDGAYWATLDKTVTDLIEPYQSYQLKITLSDVAGDDGTWYVPLVGKLRR